jgi:hypothetical protein
MDTLTLYLDALILASAAYPAGFSQSLYRLRGAGARGGATAFRAYLVLPFLFVVPAAWAAHPGLVAFRAAPAAALAAAVLLAPVALLAEFAMHGLAEYRNSGRFPRAFCIHGLWGTTSSPSAYALTGMVVLGEEIVYRLIWIDLLRGPFGLSAAAAVGASSLAYGLNHLAFGATSVASKAITGLGYGLLYLLGGGSVWPPIVAHGLQNLLLFRLARNTDG